MRTTIAALAMPLVAVLACAPAMPVVTTTLGPSPVLDGGSYSTGGGLTVAGEIQNINGMTALCGVWADGDNQSVLSARKSPGVVASGSAYVGGQVVHRGLAFMRQIAPDESFAGQRANCVLTGRAWQAGDTPQAVRFRIPRKVVDHDIDGLGGGYQVVFRQTGPGA